jgi:hypothetical protein
VVAVDPGGIGIFFDPPQQTDSLEGVSAYAHELGVTYPTGLETTSSYFQFVGSYTGANPFPLQVLVDKAGTVRYVATQYDPVTLESMIVQLLAE